MPDVNKIIDSLGQNLDMVNFFDLEHFLNLSYQHFIDLNIEKCKEVGTKLISVPETDLFLLLSFDSRIFQKAQAHAPTIFIQNFYFYSYFYFF